MKETNEPVDVPRALLRAKRMREDLDAAITYLEGVVNPDADDAFAAFVDRWWYAVLGIRDGERELRMRLIDAVGRKEATVASVREELLARWSHQDVAGFSDEQIADALAVGRKRGRTPGAPKWATLARILDGSAALAMQLEDEHRLWSSPSRRERKRAKRRAKG